MLKLGAHIAARLPFAHALDRLESQRGELLPASVGKRAARAAGQRYVSSLISRLTDGLALQQAEVVFAHRHGSGTRPVADLSVDGRLLLEALATHVVGRLAPDAEMLGLAEHLAAPEAGHRTGFEQRPLEDAQAAFIVKADVASFYEYVDHELLSREILETAGDVALAYAVRDLLAAVMGRRYGLPQGPQGSDVLASVYLSGVDRRLLRSGVRLERFNDDYLLRCRTLAEARRHLLSLEIELRAVGLILNHQKTQILSREKYEEGLMAFQELLAQAAIESVELPFGYSFDPDQFANIDLENADQATVETAFRKAVGDAALPSEVRRRMIDGALPYLAGFKSAEPLVYLGDLVERFPAQIRNVNLYLRSLITSDLETRALQSVVALLQSATSPVPWVQGWLVDFIARGARYVPSLVPWLHDIVRDPAAPWFLRTRALIATARARALPQQSEVAALFHAAPHANQPDVVAAVMLADADWSSDFLRTFTAADPVLQSIPSLLATEPLVATL